MKFNKKKVIFYVSLLPYVYLILKCIYHSIFGYEYEFYHGKIEYGIDGAMEALNNFWFDNLFMFNYVTVIFIVCIIYQLWYFITRKSNKEVDNNNAKKKINLKKFFFILCILFWIIYLCYGIYSAIFGYEYEFLGNYHISYGIKGLLDSLFILGIYFCIVPIIPISIIYIIIYTIVYYREKKRSKSNM